MGPPTANQSASDLNNGKEVPVPVLGALFLRTVLLGTILALAIWRLWLLPLPSSFWVDEMVTAFVVHFGPAHPSLAVAPQVSESIYYALPKVVERLFGFSEVIYRLPSVLLMGLALWFIARLAQRLIHPQAGWFAVFACLTMRLFNYQAADARPYAMGTCVAAAALWFLVRWLDAPAASSNPSSRWASNRGQAVLFPILFLLCGALLWRVHLVYWPFYLVLAAYTVSRMALCDTRVTWIGAVSVFAVLAILLVPVALRALAIVHEAKAHVVVDHPTTLSELNRALKLSLVLGCPLAAWLLGLVLRRANPGTASPGTNRRTGNATPDLLFQFDLRSQFDLLSARIHSDGHRLQMVKGQSFPELELVPELQLSGLVLILGWWLVHPLALYAFSAITGNSVFVDRYLSLSLPGAALAATLGTSYFLPKRFWTHAAAALGLGVVLLMGHVRDLSPMHHGSDWRKAAASIRELHLDENTPVICPSVFIEARSPVWYPNFPMPGFLSSHLLTYPIPGRVILFPFVKSPEAEAFANELARGAIAQSGRMVILGGDVNAHLWQGWFARQPALSGWQARRLGPFGDVDAVVLERGEGER